MKGHRGGSEESCCYGHVHRLAQMERERRGGAAAAWRSSVLGTVLVLSHAALGVSDALLCTFGGLYGI
jgi:hypothetical protein